MRPPRTSLRQVVDADVEERVDNPDSTVYLIFMEAPNIDSGDRMVIGFY